MDDRREGRARRARRWIVATAALASFVLVAAPATTVAATPFVVVDDVQLERAGTGAVVTARVGWHAASTGTPLNMSVGDLRLVAVGEHGHRPTLLAEDTSEIAAQPRQQMRLSVTDDDALAAMRPGNRIVLTASQHAAVTPTGSLTARSYVTVAEVQPFGSPQPHIGSDDCSATAVEPGAHLEYCDLVGAYLDGALVSEHDPDADEGKVDSLASRLLRADLTGATMVRADLSGASLADARLNGADATRAKLDNVSLAGAEAVGLIARDAHSDKDAKDSAADIFDARLTDADLRGTQFNGVSLSRSRLDGAKLQGAVWNSVLADAASFRDARLGGFTAGPGSRFYFADFTGAELADAGDGDADLSDLQLEWATLCRTTLPKALQSRPDRDCRAAVDPAPKPAPNPEQPDPYVVVEPAELEPGAGPRKVTATITWDDDARESFGMDAGDVRLVAIDGSTGVPTLIDAVSIPDGLDETTDYDITIADPQKLAAMRRGNRVVLTATQHESAGRGAWINTRSYITVHTLQRGPGRGRVGRYDCSRLALTQAPTAPFDFCDLSGAALANAGITARMMRKADLTGAVLSRARLEAVTLDGAALGGVDADDATVARGVSLFQAFAPQLSMRDATVDQGSFLADSLDGADFSRAKLWNTTTFAGASMRRAIFSDAVLDHTDLAFGRLAQTKFDGARATTASLFLADLRSATLAGSTWTLDETGELPWTWATLCDTTMPPVSGGIRGDRDCPR